MTLHGPAIVEQADTTIVVPRGWTASVIEDGSLMLRVAK
jgi:N-methylhydantoinase A/oxoprolinase/acetone carboxylase beta subunit